MTDLDLVLSEDELAELRAGATLHMHPYLTPPTAPPPVAQHYPHARFAQLFYYGTPLDATAQRLLNESIDLVVCGEANMLASLAALAPASLPLILYTNVSNLYGPLLTDWLCYATIKGIPAESAFLHDSTGARLQYTRTGGGPLTNPTTPAFIVWAVDYHRRLLAANPRTNGLFLDNSMGDPLVMSGGKAPVEDVTGYAHDYGQLIAAMKGGLKCLIVPNIAGSSDPKDKMGGADEVIPTIKAAGCFYAESAMMPLAHNWSRFQDVAAYIEECQAVPGVFGILDAHPRNPRTADEKGDPTDPRTQLAALAYYYLLAGPNDYLDFFGGAEPGTTWARHWCAAAAVDVGTPMGTWMPFQKGADPADSQATYRIYRRPYTKAVVLYRPLSMGGTKPSDLGDASAVNVLVSGKPLAADGTLGPAVTSVWLRNGEGAIVLSS